MAGMAQNSLSRLGMDLNASRGLQGWEQQRGVALPLQIRLEHSGHSGSSQGSWRHISSHGPSAPLPNTHTMWHISNQPRTHWQG